MPHPSPNFGERRGGAAPDLIVIHYTAMADCASARNRLCDPVAEVSAHYLIDRDGTVLAMVDEAHRAWHAGAGAWGAVCDVNSRSIGIELANDGAEPFAAPQILALQALLCGVMARWGIPPERVIAHSDMAPARKSDPGARFDWRGLALAGLSVWPRPGAGVVSEAGFVAAACAFGYPHAPCDILLAAVRRRFRPWARGPISPSDMGIVADLATRFPVDGGGGAA